ncbi:MAG TPA: hypothetical protein VF041_07480 [Gemmatimonadaceae bacterium]
MSTSRGEGREPFTYHYRRELRLSELLPAIGLGLGAGLAAFYLTRIMLQRAPLVPDAAGSRPERHVRSGGLTARQRA